MYFGTFLQNLDELSKINKIIQKNAAVPGTCRNVSVAGVSIGVDA